MHKHELSYTRHLRLAGEIRSCTAKPDGNRRDRPKSTHASTLRWLTALGGLGRLFFVFDRLEFSIFCFDLVE